MNPGKSPKGQTNMILLVILLIMFAAIALFLLSLASNVSQEDYMDLYVNNLMVSVMKTDTGYNDSNCRLVSDLTACAYIMPSWTCGSSGKTCMDLANETLSGYMDSFGMETKNYRYLFEVTTYGFISRTDIEQGSGTKLMFGDHDIENYLGSKRVANYAIQKSMAGDQYNLKVKLSLVRKK